MATILSSSHIKNLFGGLKNHFHASLDEYPEEYSQLLDVVSSERRYEERVQRTGFGLGVQKAEGAPVTYDTAQEGYTSRISNVTYALGFKISQEAVEDDLYIDQGASLSRWLGRAMRQTKENVCANVYNRAYNSSYVGGDGKELIANDHPSLSGDQSNLIGVASDLSEAALESLVIQIMQAKDDRGLRIQLAPTSLIVPVDLHFEATRILETELRSDTANNDINALRAKGSIPQVVVNHYLTDDAAFFIRTNVPSEEGLIFQERIALDMEEDNDFDTTNLCYRARERYGVGWADWRAIYGSPGAN